MTWRMSFILKERQKMGSKYFCWLVLKIGSRHVCCTVHILRFHVKAEMSVAPEGKNVAYSHYSDISVYCKILAISLN